MQMKQISRVIWGKSWYLCSYTALYSRLIRMINVWAFDTTAPVSQSHQDEERGPSGSENVFSSFFFRRFSWKIRKIVRWGPLTSARSNAAAAKRLKYGPVWQFISGTVVLFVRDFAFWRFLCLRMCKCKYDRFFREFPTEKSRISVMDTILYVDTDVYLIQFLYRL